MESKSAGPSSHCRVLFLSLSGVWGQDPELMALGLTLPGFVGRSLVLAFLPRLGLLDTTFHPARMSVEELRAGFQWHMKEVYSPSRVACRRAIPKNCVHIRS
jgi:hypothetical protein